MTVIPSSKITSSVLDDAYDKYIGDKIQGGVRRKSADIFDGIV